MMSDGFETFPLNLMAGSHKNLFAQVTQRFGLLSAPGLNDIASVMEASTPTFSNSSLDQIWREAESMAVDLLINFEQVNPKKPTNKYCNTLRCIVKELSDRHDLVFKGMVNRLKPDETNAFPTFVIVADEIFDDGQVNWGRIVAVYAFAARLAKYYMDNNKNEQSDNLNDSYSSRSIASQKKFALFVGKYVANKLGKWILDNGGWDAFVAYFPAEYGYDIPPDEERIPIQMIIGSHENDQGEMEVEYEQVYVARPRFGRFYEPLDETPPAPGNVEPTRGNIYYREEKRLQTFSAQWLDQYSVEPKDLARNGFVYMGPGDKVKCVFCLKTLRGWEPGDTVEREHQRHYPDCPFVLGQCYNLNVPLTVSRNASYGVKLKEEAKPQIQQADMQAVTNRLESFRMAPPTSNSKTNTFVLYFPDQRELEDKLWKCVLFTVIGFGALAMVVASR